VNKTIWVVVGVAGFILLALIVFLGVSFPKTPETVSQAEFQSYKSEAKEDFGKTNSRIDAMADSVRTLAETATTGFGQIRDELNDLKKDQEKNQAVQAVQDQLNAEKAGRELDAIKAKQSELEKDLVEAKTSWQPSPWQPSEVSFLVDKGGYYEFTITPANVEVFLDSRARAIVSYARVYLKSGWHKYWSNYPVSITITAAP